VELVGPLVAVHVPALLLDQEILHLIEQIAVALMSHLVVVIIESQIMVEELLDAGVVVIAPDAEDVLEDALDVLAIVLDALELVEVHVLVHVLEAVKDVLVVLVIVKELVLVIVKVLVMMPVRTLVVIYVM
jgi:hypothetical protein